MTEAETKPNGATEDDVIVLHVMNQTGDKTTFKVKKHMALKKIFDAYAKRSGVQVSQLKFTLDGERLKENDTPKMLELNSGDQLDVFLEQTGGASL